MMRCVTRLYIVDCPWDLFCSRNKTFVVLSRSFIAAKTGSTVLSSSAQQQKFEARTRTSRRDLRI